MNSKNKFKNIKEKTKYFAPIVVIGRAAGGITIMYMVQRIFDLFRSINVK